MDADQFIGRCKPIRLLRHGFHSGNTPRNGAAQFSAAIYHIVEGRELEIGDESEKLIQQRLRVTDFRHVIEAFDLGEVSFIPDGCSIAQVRTPRRKRENNDGDLYG